MPLGANGNGMRGEPLCYVNYPLCGFKSRSIAKRDVRFSNPNRACRMWKGSPKRVKASGLRNEWEGVPCEITWGGCDPPPFSLSLHMYVNEEEILLPHKFDGPPPSSFVLVRALTPQRRLDGGSLGLRFLIEFYCY